MPDRPSRIPKTILMQDYKAPDIRNCALVGHAATGKTTLCDAILVTAGKIGRIGSIEKRQHGVRLPRGREGSTRYRSMPRR